MDDSEIIISGPEITGPEFWGSIAEYLIPKMKEKPKDFIAQIDCATDETITSHDLLQQSLEITEGLIKFGLKADDVVMLVGSNNIRSHVAALGILFSGGIFAPIDETLRAFEIQHFLKEFRPKFVICEKDKSKEIQSCAKSTKIDTKIILMDSTVRTEDFFCWEDIRTNVDVQNYVPRGVADSKKCICTINCSSGSTGMPKGVALSHFALLESLSQAQKAPNNDLVGKFLQTSPLFWFSGTVFLLHGCFFGRTRYVPKSGAPVDILEGIQRCKPLFLLLPPATIMSVVSDENFKKYDVSSVRFLASTGGPLSQTVVNKVKEAWNGIVIHNFYGLTETTGAVIVAFGCSDPHSVGTVCEGIKVKVVDRTTGKSLGPNKIGELRVKGNRVMNGYYNNEEGTKASFDENGWLRTGDLVYYDENKVFYFESRVQEVIQYLNYKISPSEIEALIIGLPGVKDVAVVGVPHGIEVNHLRALVVKDPKSDISAEDIIQQVKVNLTDRKHLKGGVQFVDALPRTQVGKLRRAEAQKMITI